MIKAIYCVLSLQTMKITMEQNPALELCLTSIEQLSVFEKEIVFDRLQQELRKDKQAQFHVPHRTELIKNAKIRTASTDLSIMDLED